MGLIDMIILFLYVFGGPILGLLAIVVVITLFLYALKTKSDSSASIYEYSTDITEDEPKNMGPYLARYLEQEREEKRKEELKRKEEDYVKYSPKPDPTVMDDYERKRYESMRRRGWTDDDWKREEFKKKDYLH
jgi:hypothetical protein